MLDLFLSVMVFNIWGHFKILLNILETFPRPALENAETDVGSVQFSESEQADVKALLRECSDKLKHAVYEIPWECMNSKNRMTALIYLMNVQKTIHVTAGGMVDVGVTTMASV
ncbi:Odorant receptor [Operophtera brumata]|uniref:Odorant receptor n=1 Tax=Operophtera brumata TaxID=104452 RepID=A0A0L7KW47_OPEBR|nr:Odorant receptor [Operophtera brumata]